MSQQQPGPYGVPPQQPNPYTQPPAPGYPQQPQPQAGGWGPGMPPPYPPPAPPQGGGKGKAVVLAVAALVVVGAIVGGVALLAGGGKRESRSDKAGGMATASPSPGTSASAAPATKRYKIITPDTVAGEYRKDAADTGGGFDTKGLNVLRLLGVTNPQSTSGAYRSGEDKRAQKQLRFSGAWGDDVRNPELVVDGLFKDAAAGAAKDTDPDSKTEFEGSPQRMSPEGLGDAVMKCQMSKWTNPGTPGARALRMPLCIWADKSTVGTVFALDTNLIVRGEDLTLEEAADRAAKLRQDVRVEVQQ
ncbi:hypothetical protein AB0F13_19930 [Streptomyces sp. NPDC026206]|uniref:hypothetical protein n=1 Tax=Streptomyces sp. NPDC026206 TaxID=3157089 RepID=UPI0034032E59